MKDLTTYLNESLLDAIVKIFVGKIKMLQKKFNISENSINDLSTSLSEIQDELNNELKELSKGKVKDSTDWWKQLLKVKPEVAKGSVPEKINNQLFTNILNVSGVYSKALESWDSIGILDTEGIQYHIKRDIKQLIAIIETVCKDNGKQANISQQLDKLENILSQLKLKDKKAKEILDETIGELNGKGSEFLQKYKK